MAQYIPFTPDVEVNGQTILSFVRAIPIYQRQLEAILATHGLKGVQAESWYSQKKWLEAFKQIGESYGSNTLFSMGKAIPENAIFPPNILTMEDALNSINVAYHLNHRNGEIGYYKLIEYNENLQLAIMECKNPYSSHFDRGIIATMVRKFPPSIISIVDIQLDENQPTRLNGADSCTYRISW